MPKTALLEPGFLDARREAEGAAAAAAAAGGGGVGPVAFGWIGLGRDALGLAEPAAPAAAPPSSAALMEPDPSPLGDYEVACKGGTHGWRHV